MADGDGSDLVMGETVSITINPFSTDLDNTDPCIKRSRIEDTSDQNSSLRQMIFNINRSICLRLDIIEAKLEAVQNKNKELEEKVDTILNHLVATQNVTPKVEPPAIRTPNIVIGLPTRSVASPTLNTSLADITYEQDANSTIQMSAGLASTGPNITLITLNKEDDFPDGCWLGDESNPEMRVRAPISQSDLIHIHTNCRTAEKMALTFLDYLFDRETLAVSNLSGLGKHGKKQLDPLMIYGIRCHLICRFNINEQDWHRIKQNMDSKCRTAWRRKQRGLPLTVKAFRNKATPGSGGAQHNYDGSISLNGLGMQDLSSHSDDSLNHTEDNELHIQGSDGIELHNDNVISGNLAQIMQNHGANEIQVLHATPEQVAQLQQGHHIQIVQGDFISHFVTSGKDG